ncbi:hypothetical protein [Noviherbaspirillum denitrificans]|uniref:Uncharacterized protein n=1 Tax=Noviherbaspirillum denitrificans TaxID=1968433 RepID=A0A254TDG6_9BURK|nr:hypothetical protein [Noviherbaspirillum denitrificans]OWW20681.1 hypothetical protein AYR66_15505 [Noviherbaspirillum denitrificans]
MNKYYLAPSREEASLQQRKESMREQERRDTALDEALGFTFPASDPVALDCSATASLASKLEQFRVTIDFFKHARAERRM